MSEEPAGRYDCGDRRKRAASTSWSRTLRLSRLPKAPRAAALRQSLSPYVFRFATTQRRAVSDAPDHVSGVTNALPIHIVDLPVAAEPDGSHDAREPLSLPRKHRQFTQDVCRGAGNQICIHSPPKPGRRSRLRSSPDCPRSRLQDLPRRRQFRSGTFPLRHRRKLVRLGPPEADRSQ